ncbi:MULTISPECIES: S8 family peptidase [Exiguobacterium]|uniref:S8 family peptidase n=1 Tax=Exiguobacterium TaxID=33986 RepID=UPI001BEBE624|nr:MULTISPECIES: S8 family peptidase [Exiguobacterium]MCT4778064.1 peptidase S8 [Exiguobacterium aquaticum]MCT4789708.1 peptidase S8 [Exiguobacterium mexicanum]
MKATWKQVLSFVTVLMLVLALIPPQASADAGAGMQEAKTLSPGVEVTFETGTDATNTYWFKMERGTPSAMTHMEIQFDSTKLANISVYPSADLAAKDETFEQYRSSASQEDGQQTAKIRFPYAWEGPYYIKVEYLPLMEEETMSPSDIKLVYNPVKLPVKYENIETEAGMCAVESILNPAPERESMLKLIRRIQTEVLTQSESGNDLAALYYRTSPYLIKAMVKDGAKRQQAYNDLKALQPLMNALVDRKSYTLTPADDAAIERLQALVTSSVPTALQAEVNQVAAKLGTGTLAGTPLQDVMGKFGVSIEVDDAPRYIVKYKSSPSKSLGKMNALSNVSAEKVNLGRPGDHFAVVDVEAASTKTQATAKSTLERDANVEFIEPVQKYQAFMADTSYDYQWSLNSKSVLAPFQDAGIGIDAYEALNLPVRSVKVAVLDTGVDYRLLDFKGRVDIANEKNFVDPNGEGSAIDDHGHGTHVAGVIGAIQNNGTSMRGMMPAVSILPVKVLDASGSGDTEQIALGIKYAVDAGAKVINMSLGGSESRTIGYMLKYAYDRGVVVVAATGNDGDSSLSYPASSKYTISVGATNTFGIVSDYSNYGYGVDVVAPGTKVASLVPNGNVVYMDGTSMATPHVSAVVGLLLSTRPTLKVEEVRQLLHRTAEPVAFSGGDAIGGMSYEDGLSYFMDESEEELPFNYDYISGYGKVNVHYAASMLRLYAKPGIVRDNSTVFAASVQSGTKVTVYNGEKRLATGTSKQARVALNIGAQKAGTTLRVVYSNGKLASSERLLVVKGARAKQPAVSTPRANAKQVTGRADAGMTVIVRDAKRRVIGKGTTGLTGSFVTKTRTLKKGERLSVHIEDAKGRASQMKQVIVK